MNAKAIKSAEASDSVNLNRCGKMPLSDKRRILQLNEGFTNGYGQAVAGVGAPPDHVAIRQAACVRPWMYFPETSRGSARLPCRSAAQ